MKQEIALAMTAASEEKYLYLVKIDKDRIELFDCENVKSVSKSPWSWRGGGVIEDWGKVGYVSQVEPSILIHTDQRKSDMTRSTNRCRRSVVI